MSHDVAGDQEDSAPKHPGYWFIALSGKQAGIAWSLDASVITIGHSTTDADLVVDDPGVAPIHCRIVRVCDHYVLEDLGGGVMVRGRRVDAAVLQYDDKVWLTWRLDGEGCAAGEVVLKVTPRGPYVHEVDLAYALSLTHDPVTKLLNQRGLVPEAIALLLAGRRGAHDLSVCVVELDAYAALASACSARDVEAALCEVAKALAAAARSAGGAVARTAPGTFAVVVKEADSSGPDVVRNWLASAVGGLKILIEGRVARLGARVGVTRIERDQDLGDPESLLAAAIERAALEGRSCADGDVPRGASNTNAARASARTTFAAELLVQLLVGRDAKYGLLCFGIADDLGALASMGNEGRATLLEALRALVAGEARGGDLVGQWLDRYVLLAVAGDRIECINNIAAEIERKWQSNVSNSRLQPKLAPPILLGVQEVIQAGSAILDELARRLVLSERSAIDAPGAASEFARLPFPLAAPIWEARRADSPHDALKWLVDGVEVSLAFGACALLAAARDGAAPDSMAALGAFLSKKQKPSSAGTWRDVLCHLATLRFCLPDWLDPIAESAIDARGRRTELMGAVNTAIEYRNRRLVHVTGMPSEAACELMIPVVQSACLGLSEGWRVLENARLIGVAEIRRVPNPYDGIDKGVYKVIVARGPSDAHFTVEEIELEASLQRSHSYLVGPNGRALMMDPWFAVAECDTCRRKTVFVAQELVFGPVGAKVRQHGIVCNHQRQGSVPIGRRSVQLAEAVVDALNQAS